MTNQAGVAFCMQKDVMLGPHEVMQVDWTRP